jgi:hypothetical protein
MSTYTKDTSIATLKSRIVKNEFPIGGNYPVFQFSLYRWGNLLISPKRDTTAFEFKKELGNTTFIPLYVCDFMHRKELAEKTGRDKELIFSLIKNK